MLNPNYYDQGERVVKKGSTSKSSAQPPVSAAWHMLAAIGEKTAAVAAERFQDRQTLFEAREADLKEIAKAFDSGWSDSNAAKVLEAYATRILSESPLEVSALTRWLRLHVNDVACVMDCMRVEPPEEISIIKAFPHTGSQKIVFLATWQLRQKEVVLKYLIGSDEYKSQVMARELRLHPLSMAHENIIETHLLKNKNNQPFLVEKRLEPLYDDWLCPGLHEAANLLNDIANALTFLQSHKLVHGDVKPDNIGKDGDDYILLDFGVCRPAEEFGADTTATGSLRTRAPELLEHGAAYDPLKIDVWALGATVFNLFVKRFPLFNEKERPARISKPEKRREFEELLRLRAKNEWDERVVSPLNSVPDPMCHLLLNGLEKDHAKRWSVDILKHQVSQQLSAFLRPSSSVRRFAPPEECHQLHSYLKDLDVLKLMPVAQKYKLRDRLRDLKEMQGLSGAQKAQLDSLLRVVQE